jgi:hypothetical protein
MRAGGGTFSASILGRVVIGAQWSARTRLPCVKDIQDPEKEDQRLEQRERAAL